MNPKQPVKKSQNIHEERARALKKTEDNIQTVLNSAKANPKFMKLLKYSLNSLDRLITPPAADVRLNKKVILQLDGMLVLKGLAMQNLKNEEIVTQIAEIIFKLLVQDITFDYELAKLFCEKAGQEIVIEILLSKEVGPGSLPLIKILNGLVGVPSLVNKLLDSGLAETVKLVNDLYSDDLLIIEINFDTMKKVSNQKNGRDFLIEKNLMPNIILNTKKCAEAKNSKAVVTAFIVLDNLTKTPKGIDAIKMENALENLSEVLAHFEDEDIVLAMGTKVMSKVVRPEDLQKYLGVITEMTIKVKADPQIGHMRTLEHGLEIVGNLLLIDDVAKFFENSNELKKLLEQYAEINSIDLAGKNEKFIKAIMDLQKYFMIIFYRLFLVFPEVYDKISEKGRLCSYHMDNINYSLVKIWAFIKAVGEALPKEGAEAVERIQSYLKHFQDYFASFVELFLYNLKEMKKRAPTEDDMGEAMPKILISMITDIIANGQTYFGKNEKSNRAASRVLRNGAEFANYFQKAKTGIQAGLFNCYPYIKGIITTNLIIKTLSNNFDVILYLFNEGGDRSKKLREDVIPVIAKFMEYKPQFRYANSVNLAILTGYFTPDIVDVYLHRNNPRENPIHAIDFIDSVVSVQSTSEEEALELLYASEEERMNATRNEELEKSIAKMCTELLKKLVDLNEFKKRVKEFVALSQSYDPKNSTEVADMKLKKVVSFQDCAMEIKEFFKAGSKEDLEAVKVLIKRELFFIEQFKRDKTNENNPKYYEIAGFSSMRMKAYVELVKKIIDKSILHYQDSKDPLIVPQIQDGLLINLEFLDKSSDDDNLIFVLNQQRRIIPPLLENEGLLKGAKPNENLLEKMVNSLNNLLRKNIDNDEVIDALLPACLTLVKRNPEANNMFVKAGCPRVLIQVLESTTNVPVAQKASELLKLITLSNDGNIQIVANQGILSKLFEARAKFSTEETVVPEIDALTRQLALLPEQEQYINEIIKDALAGFHAVLLTDLLLSDNKLKELNYLQTLNSLSFGPKQMEKIATKEFMDDLHKSIDITVKDPELSQVTDTILMNEMDMLKKVRDNLPNNEDQMTMGTHMILADDVVMVMNQKASSNPEIFITSIRLMTSYCVTAALFDNVLKKSINPTFIDHLMETRDTYVENQEVAQEVNGLLSQICVRYPEMGQSIVSKGGIGTIIEDIRAVVSLNDENGRQKKFNGLKMLDPLLQEEKNLNEFIKYKGIKLINDLVNNELSISPPLKSERDGYMTRDTLNVKTMEEMKEIEKERINSGDAKFNRLDKDDTYFVYVLKIMQIGISKGFKEFSEEQLIKNIAKLAEANYPNRFLFMEAANLITNPAVVLPDNEEDNTALFNVALNNQVLYYKDKSVKERVKKIEEAIVGKTLTKEKYKQNYSTCLTKELETKNNLENLCRMVTYVTQLFKHKEFEAIFAQNAEQFLSLYNKTVKQLITQAEEQKPVPKTDSGIMISLLKLANYLIKKGKIPKENKSIIEDILLLGKHMYRPDNYNYVKGYNKQMLKMLELFGIKPAEPSESDGNYPEAYKSFIIFTFPKTNAFLVDHFQNFIQKKDVIIPEETKAKREKNLGLVLDNCIDFYRSQPITANTDLKAAEAQKLASNILNIFSQIKKEPTSPIAQENMARMKLLFSILGKILEQDFSNILMNDIPFLKGAIDDTYEGITSPTLKLNDPMMRKIPLAISLKQGQNEEITVKLFLPTSNDLINNDTDKQIKSDDIAILAALSGHQSNCKRIIQTPALWGKLKTYYETDTDEVNQQNLATIMKNITNSNYNTEALINNDPDAIGSLLTIVAIGAMVLSSGTQIAVACNILKDAGNVKSIISKGIKTPEQLRSIADKYKDSNPEMVKDLLELLKKIGNEEKKGDLQADKIALTSISALIDASYKKHMDDLENMSKGQFATQPPLKSTNPNARKDKGRLSIITSTILCNANNDKIVSDLSWKNNEKMNMEINEIIAAIRKLYNELIDPENASKTELNKEREDLIKEYMVLLKKLSVAPENHKEICERGLLSFMGKLHQNTSAPISITLGAKDILKNCSHSDNTIPIIINDVEVISKLIEEILYFFNNPDVINQSPEMKLTFLYDTITFNNLCNNAKGFQVIFEKIGLNKLLALGKICTDVDLQEAIVGMFVNYLQHTKNDSIDNGIFIDLVGILDQCYNYKSKTPSLIAKTEKLTSLIYLPEYQDRIDKIGIIPRVDADFNNFKVEKEYVHNTLECLSVINRNRPLNSKECLCNPIIGKLKKEVTESNHAENEDLIYQLTSMYLSLIADNKEGGEEDAKKVLERKKLITENLDKFNELELGDNAIMWLDIFQPKITQRDNEKTIKDANAYSEDTIKVVREDNADNDKDKEKKPFDAPVEIVSNVIAIINIIACGSKKAVSSLLLKRLALLLIKTITDLADKDDEISINSLISALEALANNLKNDTEGVFAKNMNFQVLLELLQNLQKKHYANPKILSPINEIAGTITKKITDRNYIPKFFDLICQSTKCQDWNAEFVQEALGIMYDPLIQHPFLIDEVFEDLWLNIYSILNLFYSHPEIQAQCYKILALFGKNKVYSYTMFNSSAILQTAKDSLDNSAFNEVPLSKTRVRTELFKLLNVCCNSESNAKEISDVLMSQLLTEINDGPMNEEKEQILKLIWGLLQHKESIQPFVQYNGLDQLIRILKENDNNLDLCLDIFGILSCIASASDDYKIMMQEKLLVPLLNEIIDKNKMYEKRIEFEGRGLIFLINSAKMVLEEMEEIQMAELKVENPIKPSVRNFLTSGKQLKIVNQDGDVKPMQLQFSPDFLKVFAKEPELLGQAPKAKYCIETTQIKQILKGFATPNFKKISIFKSNKPKPECSFAIIGPATVDGVKTLSVYCKNEHECNQWLDYMEIVIEYFKKIKTIKTGIIIKKKI